MLMDKFKAAKSIAWKRAAQHCSLKVQMNTFDLGEKNEEYKMALVAPGISRIYL